jgi:hypothetical protein
MEEMKSINHRGETVAGVVACAKLGVTVGLLGRGAHGVGRSLARLRRGGLSARARSRSRGRASAGGSGRAGWGARCAAAAGQGTAARLPVCARWRESMGEKREGGRERRGKGGRRTGAAAAWLGESRRARLGFLMGP